MITITILIKSMDMKTKKQTPALDEKSTLRVVLSHFDSKAALAEVLGLGTRQAVSNMNMDAPLSRVHYLTLRHEKRPDLYCAEKALS